MRPLAVALAGVLAGCVNTQPAVDFEDLVVVLTDVRTGAWIAGATVVATPRGGEPTPLGWRPPRDYFGGYDLDGRTIDLTVRHPDYRPVGRVVMVPEDVGAQHLPLRVDLALEPVSAR